MMPSLPLSLLVAHFLGDAVLQSDWMAIGKSKDWRPLTVHCAIYAACFFWLGLGFVAVTFVSHWLTDWFTSRVGKELFFFERNFPNTNEWRYVDGKRHAFFVWLLFDQLIHFATLAYTYQVLA